MRWGSLALAHAPADGSSIRGFQPAQTPPVHRTRCRKSTRSGLYPRTTKPTSFPADRLGLGRTIHLLRFPPDFAAERIPRHRRTVRVNQPWSFLSKVGAGGPATPNPSVDPTCAKSGALGSLFALWRMSPVQTLNRRYHVRISANLHPIAGYGPSLPKTCGSLLLPHR